MQFDDRTAGEVAKDRAAGRWRATESIHPRGRHMPKIKKLDLDGAPLAPAAGAAARLAG